MTIIVIIILAVAVILSIANNNPIENAKEAKIKNDLKTIEEELTLKQASNYVDEHANNKTPSEITIDDLASAANYKDKLIIKDGKVCIKSGSFDNEEKLSEELGIDIVAKATIKLGEEITYKNESFYVIGGDNVGTAIADSTQDILLLAKYNLKKEGTEITLKQDTSGESNACVFSSTYYWSSVSGIAYPDSTTKKYPDLNDVEKYPIGSATSIITIAKNYGVNLGAEEGRLMTYEEAKALQTDEYSDILYGKKTEIGYLNYWLSSAQNKNDVWSSVGEGSRLGSYGFSIGGGFGVRPVIKVSKSSIQ